MIMNSETVKQGMLSGTTSAQLEVPDSPPDRLMENLGTILQFTYQKHRHGLKYTPLRGKNLSEFANELSKDTEELDDWNLHCKQTSEIGIAVKETFPTIVGGLDFSRYNANEWDFHLNVSDRVFLSYKENFRARQIFRSKIATINDEYPDDFGGDQQFGSLGYINSVCKGTVKVELVRITNNTMMSTAAWGGAKVMTGAGGSNAHVVSSKTTTEKKTWSITTGALGFAASVILTQKVVSKDGTAQFLQSRNPMRWSNVTTRQKIESFFKHGNLRTISNLNFDRFTIDDLVSYAFPVVFSISDAESTYESELHWTARKAVDMFGHGGDLPETLQTQLESQTQSCSLQMSTPSTADLADPAVASAAKEAVLECLPANLQDAKLDVKFAAIESYHLIVEGPRDIFAFLFNELRRTGGPMDLANGWKLLAVKPAVAFNPKCFGMISAAAEDAASVPGAIVRYGDDVLATLHPIEGSNSIIAIDPTSDDPFRVREYLEFVNESDGAKISDLEARGYVRVNLTKDWIVPDEYAGKLHFCKQQLVGGGCERSPTTPPSVQEHLKQETEAEGEKKPHDSPIAGTAGNRVSTPPRQP